MSEVRDCLRLTRYAMACEFEIILQGEDRTALRDIACLALDEVERLGGELSCFGPRSEVSLVNAEAARKSVIVGPDLFEILRTAEEVWRETDGAFDVTAGPVIDLWRAAEETGKPPEQQAIDAALAKVGMGHVALDDRVNSVRFDAEGVQINLGAIGKGYAAQKASSILREYGVESALVSAGRSTILALGDGPEGDGWRVGIRHPAKLDERVREIVLKDQAMSTSGGPAQRDAHVEERFEHIIDPVTGTPAESAAASVTVIASDAMLSDALATAFYLRGPKLAERFPNVKAIFIPLQ